MGMKIFRSIWVILGLVLLIALMLIVGGPDNRVDAGVVQYFETVRAAHPAFTWWMTILTQVGGVYATLGTAAASTLWLMYRKQWKTAAFLIGGAMFARLLLDLAKLIVDRPRPHFDVHPVITHSSSFPSGHSANTMSIYLMVALALAPARWRSHALAGAASVAIASGLTRPFLGVHWPSDVIGGWALGLAAFWAFVRAGERLAVLPNEQQHQIVGGHRAALDQA